MRAAGGLEATVERLVELPGVGPWTAQVIAMRALREPDAFPASDLGLLRGATQEGVRPGPAELSARAEAWRPWRAYAVMHLWTALPDPSQQASPPSAGRSEHDKRPRAGRQRAG